MDVDAPLGEVDVFLLEGGLELVARLDRMGGGQLPDLRQLALWRIAKLESVELIAERRALEGVFLDTLNAVKKVPETKKLTRLRVVKLASMKNLRDFSSLERAPALEELVFQNAATQRPEDFLPVLRNLRLQRGGFGFYKKDDIRRTTELLAEHGVDGQVYRYPQVRGHFPGFNAAES